MDLSLWLCIEGSSGTDCDSPCPRPSSESGPSKQRKTLPRILGNGEIYALVNLTTIQNLLAKIAVCSH